MEEYKNAEEEQALPNNQQQLITNKNGGCWMSNSMKEKKRQILSILRMLGGCSIFSVCHGRWKTMLG
jgi:hypothetical protein